MWSSALIAISTAVVVWVQPVTAQATTNVTCDASATWMVNADDQNPCLVAAYLSAVCNSGTWFVPTLVEQGVPYNAPVDDGVNACRCNVVVYSLLQACAYCQHGFVGTWTDWIVNCPQKYIREYYPIAVPDGTTIPPWATIDPRATNLWNATEAQAFAVGNAVQTPKKKTNVGAIVGGAVGGLVGLLLLVIAGVLVYRRYFRPKTQTPEPPMQDVVLQPSHPKSTGSPSSDQTHVNPIFSAGQPSTLGDRRASNPVRTDPNVYPSRASPARMRTYDPDDPTTFPLPLSPVEPGQVYEPVTHTQTIEYAPQPQNLFQPPRSGPEFDSRDPTTYPPSSLGTATFQDHQRIPALTSSLGHDPRESTWSRPSNQTTPRPVDPADPSTFPLSPTETTSFAASASGYANPGSFSASNPETYPMSPLTDTFATIDAGSVAPSHSNPPRSTREIV